MNIDWVLVGALVFGAGVWLATEYACRWFKDKTRGIR